MNIARCPREYSIDTSILRLFAIDVTAELLLGDGWGWEKERENYCFRTQIGCVRAQSIDLNQKKCGFYAKMGDNPLRIAKIAVPLHRRKETSRLLQ